MTRATRIGLALLGLAIAAATVLGAFDQSDWLWGFGGFRHHRALELAVALAALLAVVSIPAVGRMVGRLATAIPLPTRGAGPFVVGALTAVGFSFARSFGLAGDWALVLGRYLDGVYYPSNVGANLLARVVGLGTEAAGLLPETAIQTTSAIAGGVFVAFTLRIAGRLGASARHARFIAWFTILSGSTLVFFGHLEVYGPLVAAVVIAIDVALAYRAGDVRVGAVGLWLGVAVCVHGLAALLFPAFAIAAWRWAPANRARAAALMTALFALPIAIAAIALFAFAWGFAAPSDAALRYGTFLGAAGQTPWTPIAHQPGYLYALSEIDHWRDRLNVLFRLCPLGLILGLGLLARRCPAPGHGLLRGSVMLALAWTAIHNVSYPIRLDWDLFAVVGVLLALHAAAALSSRDDQAMGTLLGLAAFCAIPWWVAAIAPLPEVRIDYHRELRGVYQARGHVAGFESHLVAAASVEPSDYRALADASEYYLSRRRLVEAERFVTAGAAAFPNDWQFASNLARFRFQRGKVQAALGPMRIAVENRPGDALLHRQYGEMLFRAQRPADAIPHYERAADLEPENRDYTLDYFTIASDPLVNRGREALPRLARLADLRPDDIDVLKRLARAYRRHGKLQDANDIELRLIAARRRAAERPKQ